MTDRTQDRIELAEAWRPIPSFPGYEVSQSGEVRSWRHKNGRRKQPYILKPSPKSNGYLAVSLRDKHGAIKNCTVHRLVARAFLRGDGPMVLHRDGDKTNNSVFNLRYGTAADNAEDAYRHGALNMGQGHYKAKLSRENVISIRVALLQGCKQADLARQYGVHPSTIQKIVAQRNWRRT